jgi:hypothetical protein
MTGDQMEASESIAATDLYGKPITIGTTVKYISTRTVGKVIDIKREDDRTWAEVDSTHLYYDTRYLEVTTAKTVIDDDEEAAKMDMDEVEKKVRNMEEMLKIKDVSNDSSCEGGG